ncbi:hypothetical protein EKL97_10505 [Flavobacterium sp. LS1P28]|uniref:phage capsid protein n=1 Tax=Flavobacterium sp. LS1P28 TaxID=2497752 RepID=UPI000F8431DC|nr:phage capsid protein [Flavobacterium sp. LS1P28]RTY80687.1 hypothetical protein EKL97_10505 [Flavobacterium sp. LS1P28]
MKNKFGIIFGLVLMVVAVATGFAKEHPKGVAMAAVTIVDGDLLNELNEKFILTKFRSLGTWLSEVTSKDSWVGNNAIKIPKRKGDSAPIVLINNTVYPMVSSGRDDEKVVVSLNKYSTENRHVTQDELYAIAYDKEGDINMELKEELEIKVTEHALYSISPVSNSASTPVLETTGAADGTRKRLSKADVIRLKAALDAGSVPKTGRIWVMSSTHANDLLLEDAAFEKGYHNRVDGTISINYYGFKIYEEVYTPTYHATTKAKLAFDSVTAGRTSSIIFHKSSCVKAKGTVERFARDKKADPENRKSVVGYDLYFGCFAIQDQGLAAIIDGVVA